MAWTSRQRALIAGLGVVVVALGAVTMIAWPDGDQPVAASDGDATTTTTTAPRRTTTTAEPTTTSTTDATTTTEAPTTTRAPTTTAPPSTMPPPPPPTTVPPPPYRSSIESVTAAQLGASYRSGIGCTEPGSLRAVNVTHWGYDGAVHEGRLIVHQAEAANVAAIFGDLYGARFPIQRIEPVSAYGADDQASMRANNTSAYNCRTVAGSSTLSNHAYGRAIDVNPLHNPYVKGGSVDPPEGAAWADRSNRRPGMIFGGDAVVTAFSARGWSWGGYWSSGQDYQHFDKA